MAIAGISGVNQWVGAVSVSLYVCIYLSVSLFVSASKINLKSLWIKFYLKQKLKKKQQKEKKKNKLLFILSLLHKKKEHFNASFPSSIMEEAHIIRKRKVLCSQWTYLTILAIKKNFFSQISENFIYQTLAYSKDLQTTGPGIKSGFQPVV